MKYKYTGEDEAITLREVSFPKGKAVDVDCPDLQAKLAGLDYFKGVRPRAKRDQNSG